MTAMFLALGFALPFLTGQIPAIGRMLLPMHIPVFLCALLCGAEYSVPMAFLLPLLRSLLFARPNLYPEAIAIAFELVTYALAAGLLYRRWRGRLGRLYAALLLAMLVGRLVRTAVEFALLGMAELPIALGIFFTGTILAGIPGILLQLLLIPAVMAALGETGQHRKKEPYGE